MHRCQGNMVAIGCAVVFFAGLPTHLVQELIVSTVYLAQYNVSSTFNV